MQSVHRQHRNRAFSACIAALSINGFAQTAPATPGPAKSPPVQTGTSAISTTDPLAAIPELDTPEKRQAFRVFWRDLHDSCVHSLERAPRSFTVTPQAGNNPDQTKLETFFYHNTKLNELFYSQTPATQPQGKLLQFPLAPGYSQLSPIGRSLVILCENRLSIIEQRSSRMVRHCMPPDEIISISHMNALEQRISTLRALRQKETIDQATYDASLQAVANEALHDIQVLAILPPMPFQLDNWIIVPLQQEADLSIEAWTLRFNSVKKAIGEEIAAARKAAPANANPKASNPVAQAENRLAQAEKFMKGLRQMLEEQKAIEPQLRAIIMELEK